MNDQSKVVNRWPTHHLDSVELHNTYDVDTLGTVIPFPQEHVYAQENGENGISKDVLGIQNGNEFILNADQTLSLKEQQENIDRRMNKRRVPNFGRRKYIPKGNPHHPFKGFRKYHKTCPRYHESRDDPPRVFKPGVIERLRKTNCVRPRSDILKKDSPDESSNPTDDDTYQDADGSIKSSSSSSSDNDDDFRTHEDDIPFENTEPDCMSVSESPMSITEYKTRILKQDDNVSKTSNFNNNNYRNNEKDMGKSKKVNGNKSIYVMGGKRSIKPKINAKNTSRTKIQKPKNIVFEQLKYNQECEASEQIVSKSVNVVQPLPVCQLPMVSVFSTSQHLIQDGTVNSTTSSPQVYTQSTNPWPVDPSTPSMMGDQISPPPPPGLPSLNNSNINSGNGTGKDEISQSIESPLGSTSMKKKKEMEIKEQARLPEEIEKFHRKVEEGSYEVLSKVQFEIMVNEYNIGKQPCVTDGILLYPTTADVEERYAGEEQWRIENNRTPDPASIVRFKERISKYKYVDQDGFRGCVFHEKQSLCISKKKKKQVMYLTPQPAVCWKDVKRVHDLCKLNHRQDARSSSLMNYDQMSTDAPTELQVGSDTDNEVKSIEEEKMFLMRVKIKI